MYEMLQDVGMNDFTKEELIDILFSMEQWCSPECNHDNYVAIREKIQSLIDNHQDEKEIYSCHTALAISDDFFCQQQSMNADDLLPDIHQLVNKCDGMIRESGNYAFKLRIVKIK